MSEGSTFSVEKKAMLLDRHAVLQIVSALRRYRQASEVLLSARYQDGSLDRAAASTFAREIAAIDEDIS